MLQESVRPRVLAAVALLPVLIAVSGCTGAGKDSPKPPALPKPLPLGLDEFEMKVPQDNPLTAEKVQLGWHLYFDKRLSADGTVACATCHAPEHGWSDGKALMVGIRGQVGGRNSPTIINRVFSDLQFWDGRAKTLEEQALGPIQADKEMGNTLEQLVTTLSGIDGYKPLFKAAFGDETVSPQRVAQAIASFERTVVSGNSAYDRYEQGDKSALSESAARGREIFFDNNKGRCSICHAGFNFTDEKYHNIGVGTEKPGWEAEHGGRFVVTKKVEETGAYKTPTLRNVTDSGPYMHDGSQNTLEEVVDFYVKGGHPNEHLDKEMRPLTLNEQEKKDLVEFMKALSGDVTKVDMPPQL